MKLSDLAPVQFAADPRRDLFVFGATDDSRQVRYGTVFFARPGLTTSGLDFVRQAAQAGAQAIVVPEDTPDEAIALSDYERSKIAIIRHPDVTGLYARTVARFQPRQPARITAVTGTNGKTSVANFVKDILAHAGRTAMSLGTLGLRARGQVHTDVEASMTTFDPATLHLILSQLAEVHGVTDLAMEVSSHALDQRRADGIAFAAAAFTNLSQDHLDYHRTMEAYFAAKLRLFTDLLAPSGTAVVNIDDPHGPLVAAAARKLRRAVITVSHRGTPADLMELSRRIEGAGQVIEAQVFGQHQEITIPLAGAFQSQNVLTAIGLCVATGVDPDVAVGGAATLEPVPGRVEKVLTLKSGAHVYVDFAHTPDALTNVLSSLRPHVRDKARLSVVFGCGGDRDRAKRPLMAAAAVQGADQVYVTDDNPRTEDAAAIRAEALAGADGAAGVVDAGDRAVAIETALKALKAGDVLVIAGKGHETYQILPAPTADNPKATRKTAFSDVGVVRETVARLKL